MLKTTFQKTSNQMLLSYAVPIVCLFGLGLSVHLKIKKTLEIEMRQTLLDEAEHLSSDATYQLVDAIRKAEGNIIYPEQTRYVALYEKNYQKFLEDIAGLNELAEKQQDAEQQTLFKSLADEGNRIDGVVRQIFGYLAQPAIAPAIALTPKLETDNVDANRQAIHEYLESQIDQNAQQLEAARQQLLSYVIWGTAIASLATIAIGVWVTLQMRRQIQKIVGVVEQNGIQVTTSSTQIAASSRQLEATVTEQVASTTQITATAKEIAATAEELSQTMSQVMGLADVAAMTASTGKQDLDKMANTIQRLIAATTIISSKLGLIDDKANNISAVVTAITKVADQTNLLSLNAAIEAEKAGEYGAGFSVVAREIRRLADQTAIATLDIENMVQAMLSSVSAGVMEMDKFTQDVGNSAHSISQISEQMAQIIQQVQSLAPQFEMVSDGMSAQSQGAQQIRAAMEQLNDTSQQTAESVRDTNQVIIQLSDIAQDLQTEVAHLRLAV